MNHKVLIIDGDKVQTDLLKEALEREKHEVTVAENGTVSM